MVFERLGTLSLKKRNYWISLSIGPLIIILAAFILYSLFSSLKEFQETLETVRSKAVQTFQLRKGNQNFQSTFKDSDPEFLQNLENLSLLENEKIRLLDLAKSPLYQGHPDLLKRIQFIEGNKLHFSKESERSQNEIQETDYHLSSIELSSLDLQNLLELLEQKNSKKPPQIVITDCHVKKLPSKHFGLELSLLQREFIHK